MAIESSFAICTRISSPAFSRYRRAKVHFLSPMQPSMSFVFVADISPLFWSHDCSDELRSDHAMIACALGIIEQATFFDSLAMSGQRIAPFADECVRCMGLLGHSNGWRSRNLFLVESHGDAMFYLSLCHVQSVLLFLWFLVSQVHGIS